MIDVTFDVRTDTPPGKDPDAYSQTLREYHRLLWSKPLPGGAEFTLDTSQKRLYLHHRSELGEFWLASDTVIPSFWKEQKIAHIIDQLPPGELEAFHTLGYTIGGMMIFPGNRVDGKMTINGRRGFHNQIKDRFDLTVECIRLHYLGMENPLDDTLNRYADFFGLFEDFQGYVDFFLLQDMVTDDYSAVEFFAPFSGFEPYPVPQDIDAYNSYKELASDFIRARNRRIQGVFNAPAA